MTDRLGEALARTEGRMLDADEETIVAAAHNWHDLDPHNDKLVQIGISALMGRYPEVFGPFLAEGATRTVILALVDALTVTAEEVNA